MPRRIAIVLGHPDPAEERLCRGLARAYRDGAIAAGHTVDLIDLATLDVPFLRSQTEFEHGTVPAGLEAARDAIVAADHLVLVFPLWLGTTPALLKAFLEQIARPGVAFEYQAKGFPKKLFRGKSARIVCTMGMPALLYRIVYLSHGLRALRRNILGFVGVSPIRETLIGNIGGASEATRRGWIEAMRERGRRGA